MKKYKQNNLFSSVSLENLKVNGKIGKLMDTFFEERVLSDFARNVIYKETEDAFRNQLDDQNIAGIWQGEFWGKWIISGARVSRYYGDEELKAFLLKAGKTMLSFQREDGYIGTYKNSLNVFAPDPEVTKKVMGWPCKWNWNIWCRKYTLWGLIEIYQLTNDGEILQGTVRFADHLIRELKENNINIAHTGTFSGLPSCSIMKPMLILYRITENEDYLNFCLDIAKYWETEKPALIGNSLLDKDTADWYEDPVSWSKVYECLSCFDGLLELYRVTADKKYLDATESFYEILERCEKNLLFTVGYNDQFRTAINELNVLSEPCDAIHYIRVCYELFALTGKVKYLDSLELCYYNAMLASPTKDGKWGARTVRTAGKQGYAHNQANMKHSHCCVNNIPRGLLNAVECAVMVKEDELFINLYHPFEAEVSVCQKPVKIISCADYIADCRGEIYLDSPVDLAFRIPEWSKTATVTVNGKSMKAESGFFHIKSDDIPYSEEGVKIGLAFDDKVRIIPFTKEVPQRTEKDWQYIRWNDGKGPAPTLGRVFINDKRCLLQRGAVLLCRSKLIGNTASEMFDGENLIDESFKCELVRCETDAEVNAKWTATFTKGEKTFSTVVCDYPFAANMETDDEEYFSVYF